MEAMMTEDRELLPLRDYTFGDSAGILWLLYIFYIMDLATKGCTSVSIHQPMHLVSEHFSFRDTSEYLKKKKTKKHQKMKTHFIKTLFSSIALEWLRFC